MSQSVNNNVVTFVSPIVNIKWSTFSDSTEKNCLPYLVMCIQLKWQLNHLVIQMWPSFGDPLLKISCAKPNKDKIKSIGYPVTWESVVNLGCDLFCDKSPNDFIPCHKGASHKPCTTVILHYRLQIRVILESEDDIDINASSSAVRLTFVTIYDFTDTPQRMAVLYRFYIGRINLQLFFE